MKIFLSTTILFALISCNANKQDLQSNSLFEELLVDYYQGAEFRFYEIISEPDEFKLLLKDKRLKNKITPEDIKKYNFAILNLGKRNTGGYGIGVEKVKITKDKALVYIKETLPKPMENVTYAITYPMCVVKIKTKKPLEFIDAETLQENKDNN